jgi:uncharacterized protein (TIGR02147 family)
MGLANNELRYFHALVDFNQAKNAEEKKKNFDELNGLRRNTSYYKINKPHYEYLSKWYNIVVRELAVSAPWRGNYALLASLVQPPISESEARNAIKLLLDTGLLSRNEDGSFRQTDEVLTTKDVPGHLIKLVRKQFIELSVRASEETEPCERNLGSTTLTLSKEGFQKAVEIMDDTRRRIIALSKDEEPVSRVYQVHVHLFPLSKELDSGEEQ